MPSRKRHCACAKANRRQTTTSQARREATAGESPARTQVKNPPRLRADGRAVATRQVHRALLESRACRAGSPGREPAEGLKLPAASGEAMLTQEPTSKPETPSWTWFWSGGLAGAPWLPPSRAGSKPCAEPRRG